MTTRMTSTHCTSTIAWRFTTLTSTSTECAHARVVSLSLIIHTHFWLKFEPCPHSTHDHHHGHPCGCCLFAFTSSPSSCLSSSFLSSTSATSSSQSSTRRSWKTCATPLPTGVRAPTTYEPNGHDFNELQNSSVPLSFKIPAADQDVDDLTLGEMLTEAHRGQVDYFVQEGVSVSQLSSSARFDRSGQPDGEINRR